MIKQKQEKLKLLRIDQIKNRERDEMKDCTFNPKINDYVLNGKTKISDLEQQLLNSKMKRMKMESKFLDHDLEEQSFIPKICEKSRKMV